MYCFERVLRCKINKSIQVFFWSGASGHSTSSNPGIAWFHYHLEKNHLFVQVLVKSAEYTPGKAVDKNIISNES